jgi:hypothetical protein
MLMTEKGALHQVGDCSVKAAVEVRLPKMLAAIGVTNLPPGEPTLEWDMVALRSAPPIEIRPGPAKTLGEILGCRYLLVPLMGEDFFFHRCLQLLVFIPFAEQWRLRRQSGMLFILVDCATESVPLACRAHVIDDDSFRWLRELSRKKVTPRTEMMISLCRMLGHGVTAREGSIRDLTKECANPSLRLSKRY